MVKKLRRDRRSAAEDVCWSLMLMMNLGGLDSISMEWRDFLGKPLKEWADLSVKTGEMKGD